MEFLGAGAGDATPLVGGSVEGVVVVEGGGRSLVLFESGWKAEVAVM